MDISLPPERKQERRELIVRLRRDLVAVSAEFGYRKRPALSFDRPAPSGVDQRVGLGLKVFFREVSLWPYASFGFVALRDFLVAADIGLPAPARGAPAVHVAVQPSELLGARTNEWKLNSELQIPVIAARWSEFLSSAEGFFSWYGSVEDALSAWEAKNPLFHNMSEYYYPGLLFLTGRQNLAILTAQRALAGRRHDSGPRDPRAVQLHRFVDHLRAVRHSAVSRYS